MSGPWEDFSPQEDGPWSDFAKPKAAAPQEAAPTPTGSNWQNFTAGMGKAIADMGRGALQIAAPVGDAIAQGRASQQGVPYQPGTAQGMVNQMVTDSRELDAPLMDTKMGKAGYVSGGIASAVPASMIPGANTVVGAGLTGGMFGALQPADSQTDRLKNIGVGGAFGAGGQYLGGKIAGAVDDKLAQRAAGKAAEQAANAPRDAVLAEARKAGLAVPPTAINQNATNTALESLSGKAATRQALSTHNADIMDGLIADDLGIDSTITRKALGEVRKEAGKAYEAVASLPAKAGEQGDSLFNVASTPDIDPKKMLFDLRQSRNDATAWYKAYSRTANPRSLQRAQAAEAAASKLENSLEDYAASVGRDDLVPAMREARKMIAKSYEAEAALKNGHIDAAKYAAKLRKNAPLSGGAKLVAEFADQFPDVAKLPKSGDGVSKLAAVLASGGVGAGAMVGGVPGAALAAGGVAVPYLTRQMMMSGVGQGLLATPKYAPGLLSTGLLNTAGTIGKFGALPSAIYATQQ